MREIGCLFAMGESSSACLCYEKEKSVSENGCESYVQFERERERERERDGTSMCP